MAVSRFFLLVLLLSGSCMLSAQQPNILLFLADDMTWRDCQPYGNPDVITPNMQRLADEGMCFDNMFTATAMCAPTRQQLYTGIFPARNGAYPNHSRVYDGVKSMVHHFDELGYRVVLLGKTHFGPAESFPFDYLKGREHDSGRNGRDIEMQEARDVIMDDRPFVLIVAQNQPHKPWNRGNPGVYDADELEVPPYLVDLPETREQMTRYYAEITYADSLLGECLTFLDEAGKTDNTITIFTSEQGSQFPFGKWTCYDLGLKTSFIARWPGHIAPGTRSDAMAQYVDVVPTLLEAVGRDPERIDVGISDSHGDRGFDGRSFWEVMTGVSTVHRAYVYGIQTTRGIFSGSATYPIRSVRSGRYKYIRNLSFESTFYNIAGTRDNEILHVWLGATQAGTERGDYVRKYHNRPYEELYDMEADPYELHNLAEDPDYESVIEALAPELDRWMIQQGDLGVSTEMEALGRRENGGGNWRPYEP